MSAEQIEQIDDPVVQEAVTQLVSEPEQLTVEQLESIVDVVEEFDSETLTAVAEALSEAPPEVKAQFEEEVNIYDGAFDAYVPAGSNVTVSQRRTIVVITAATASPLSPLAPASVRRRKTL